jgi:hypothetical protein
MSNCDWPPLPSIPFPPPIPAPPNPLALLQRLLDLLTWPSLPGLDLPLPSLPQLPGLDISLPSLPSLPFPPALPLPPNLLALLQRLLDLLTLPACPLD